MAEAAQARLHAANEDRYIAVRLPDAVAVHHHRAIRAHACLAAGGISVIVAALLGHGIVVDHAVDHAGGHQEAQARLAEALEGALVLPVRQAEHRHPVAGLLQHAADDGVPEGRVIHIGLANDIYEIRRIPAALAAFFQGHREKLLVHGFILLYQGYDNIVDDCSGKVKSAAMDKRLRFML